METAMAEDIIQTAVSLLEEEISILPVGKHKRPTLASWAHLQESPMTPQDGANYFKNQYGIGLICGKINGNLEAIDFDPHDGDIEPIFNAYMSDPGVAAILSNNPLYIEKSPSGGYHLLYRYEVEKTIQGGATVMARWEDGSTLIESRSEGNYIIIAPTPGYKAIEGEIFKIPTITQDEREYLINHARSYDKRGKDQQTVNAPLNNGAYHHTDPVSYFNWNHADYAKQLLEKNKWTCLDYDKIEKIEKWRRPGKSDGHSATWGWKHNALHVFTGSAAPFEKDKYYSPYQILVLLQFNGDYRKAHSWIELKHLKSDFGFIRVATDYMKVIEKTDRYGIKRTELKPWKKDEIKQDHGSAYLTKIPLFDDFTLTPSNTNYQPIIENCYNLYRPFRHEPKAGQWEWTNTLLGHIFDEQFELGIRYLQALYLHPDRMLPILVMVSLERQTGKTTFLNWLNMIFGDNMAMISPEDLTGSFNDVYAHANIMAIEEAFIEKSITVEKLKNLATTKFLTVNAKWISKYKIPFFGKIIMASNNEDKFARIDDEEIRFFVRKVGKPKVKNHNIEEDLQNEIPAFLHYLTTLPPIDWSRDRSGFTPEELNNASLQKVKQESKAGLYKELSLLITELFDNHPENATSFMAAPTDIKNKWFKNNSKIEAHYIGRVLREDFKLKANKLQKYHPFGESYQYEDNGNGLSTRIPAAPKAGRPFAFDIENFTSHND
jgi:hypothetical protein